VIRPLLFFRGDSMKIFYFFGDSVTLGVNDACAGGWVARLAGMAAERGLPVPPDTFYNLGARKHSSRQILDRWEREYACRALDGASAYFVFCCGTVDMAAPHGIPAVPIGESASNVREILLKAREYGSCVLLSPAPVRNGEHNQCLEALSTAYGNICSAIGVPFIDLFHPLMEQGYVDDLADGVHPGSRGNTMIAGLLSEALKGWFMEKNA